MSASISNHYETYYADKLWNLLPAVYRAEDTDKFDANGPLREMVNRIGAQMAILRVSIDRMWEDQSIETCDDWVIPYIGELLATNLVASLDARGQRLDVANTIAYRLRKGTLAIVEEVAATITGWDTKAVEFFRRLDRTRHGLDPAIGPRVAEDSALGQLQIAEGLVGNTTRTSIGGFADLRNVYGATKAHSAFDEFFHTADVRAGLGRYGWYDIPKIGVFLWRIQSFGVGPVTPIEVRGCPGWYTFDPTGRDVPLFAVPRQPDAYRDNWVSPSEAQIAAPISQALFDAHLELYSNAMSVMLDVPSLDLVPTSELLVRPPRGRFAFVGSLPEGPFVANYHYGFPSTIGASTYDRRQGGISIDQPAPMVSISGGGPALIPTAAIPPSGTLTVSDSLTYDGATAVSVSSELTLRAGNFQRPLLRLPDPAEPWIITGAPGSFLTLDGLFVSGGDIILRGSFECVQLSCCTLDPGTAAQSTQFAQGAQSPPASLYRIAADGRDLVSTRVWVEADVVGMNIDRCVLGPVHTRNGGTIQKLQISNSIVQAIRTSSFGPIETQDVKDAYPFERRVQLDLDPVSMMLQRLQPQIGALLGSGYSPPVMDSPPSLADLQVMLDLINDILAGPSIYDTTVFAGVPLSRTTHAFALAAESSPAAIPALNRSLLEDAYPLELADAALALGDGTVQLSRCTILGRVVVHRLEASECILQGLTQVDDTQDGCIRFSTFVTGSIVPRQFESVQIPDEAPLFTAIDFGEPGYAQLTLLVDSSILPAGTPGIPSNTISAGAEDRSEMGAYARDENPIKAAALAIKLQEFMPASLVPVIVMVT